MKKGQKLSKTSAKRKSVNEFWLNVATDLNAGMDPAEIAKKYINKTTGKPYTREHIYLIRRRIKVFFIN